jgi:hypothetical protein
MKIPEFKRSGMGLIVEFRGIPNGCSNQVANATATDIATATAIALATAIPQAIAATTATKVEGEILGTG